MAYTDASEVQKLLGRVQLTATSTVTLDEVEGFAGQVSAEIDVALEANGYSLPLTGPGHLLVWLEQVAAAGVAAMVLKAWFPDSGGPNSETAWSFFEKRYRDALKLLRSGEMVPESMKSALSVARPASHTTKLNPAPTPAFTRGMSF